MHDHANMVNQQSKQMHAPVVTFSKAALSCEEAWISCIASLRLCIATCNVHYTTARSESIKGTLQNILRVQGTCGRSKVYVPYYMLFNRPGVFIFRLENASFFSNRLKMQALSRSIIDKGCVQKSGTNFNSFQKRNFHNFLRFSKLVLF